MPLSPPWHWAMHDQPADTDTIWVVRIGDPEKPWRGQYNQATIDVTTLDLTSNFTVAWLLILKWRPE